MDRKVLSLGQGSVRMEMIRSSSTRAKTLKEAAQLIEAGFDYITEIDDCKPFRKRK